jgi:hypothetical protein
MAGTVREAPLLSDSGQLGWQHHGPAESGDGRRVQRGPRRAVPDAGDQRTGGEPVCPADSRWRPSWPWRRKVRSSMPPNEASAREEPGGGLRGRAQRAPRPGCRPRVFPALRHASDGRPIDNRPAGCQPAPHGGKLQKGGLRCRAQRAPRPRACPTGGAAR